MPARAGVISNGNSMQWVSLETLLTPSFSKLIQGLLNWSSAISPHMFLPLIIIHIGVFEKAPQ